MNKIARFHQSLTNINFEMLFAYITSENQQRQQLLQQLLGIFSKALLIFLMEKPIASVILFLFVIKMSTGTGISSLFSLLPKPVGLSEFLILEKLQEILALPQKRT